MIYDLIVVGGGPAGTAAAIIAARDGAQVLLLERGRFPRHKVCGEFVSAESLGLVADLLGSTHELIRGAPRMGSARLFIGTRVVNAEVAPAAASIARFDLDSALWQAALRAGVDARAQIAVQRITGTGQFAAATGAGEFESRAVIDASGRWSNLKPATSQQGNGQKWIGLKAHFTEAAPHPSVDLYFFEGGYCGVQPVQLFGLTEPGVNACAMVRADVATTLGEVFARHPALIERSRGWTQTIETVTTSPLIFSPPVPERNGIFCAGDAAGFVDPFIGDGISLALHSGTLAANCLRRFLGGASTLQSAIEEYRTAYAQRLAPVFRRSARLRRLLALPGELLRWFVPLMELSVVSNRVINSTRVRTGKKARVSPM